MKRRVLIVLIGLNLLLIWGSSCMPGEDSAAFSGGVMEFLARFLPGLNTEFGHTLVRKLGHFSEFACLGLLSAALWRLEKGQVPLLSALAGMAVGCVDETIQIFVDGRSSSLIDVWIDSAGFAVGMAVLILIAARKRI